MEFMKAREAETYALMRIVIGFLFLWHGVQKLFGWPQPMPPDVPAFVIWVAGPLELFGGILVMSGLMACAYWMAHGTKALLPSMNGGELAAIYCFVFLFISARGSGIWSLDGGA
jgi:putative oxidoreductase